MWEVTLESPGVLGRKLPGSASQDWTIREDVMKLLTWSFNMAKGSPSVS
jgi:hypothetical protein